MLEAPKHSSTPKLECWSTQIFMGKLFIEFSLTVYQLQCVQPTHLTPTFVYQNLFSIHLIFIWLDYIFGKRTGCSSDYTYVTNLPHSVVPGEDALPVHAARLVRSRLRDVVRVAAHAASALVLLPLDCKQYKLLHRKRGSEMDDNHMKYTWKQKDRTHCTASNTSCYRGSDEIIERRSRIHWTATSKSHYRGRERVKYTHEQ